MNRYQFLLCILTMFLLSCKQEGKQQIPNVLFCLADDASYEFYKSQDYTWIQTPNMDKIANEGIVFSNAYTPNAKCAPSRACILTGRYSWQLEEAGNHCGFWPDQKYTTFTEVLSENGFYTGYTGKGWLPGNPGIKDGKKRELIGREFNEHKLVPPTKAISAIDYAENFKDFMETRPKDQPFFFWYGSFEPHRGYAYRSGIEKGNKQLEDITEVPDFWPSTDSVKTDMLDYAYELEYYDETLGKMIRILEENGELENTIIVLSADNGMPFPRVKGQNYELSNHVPLVISWKNGNYKCQEIDAYLSFVDFAPTFLELAGIDDEAKGMSPIAGKSFYDILMGKTTTTEAEYVLMGKERHDAGRPHNEGYPIRGILRDSFLFVENYKPERWPTGNPETGYMNCDGGPTKTQCLNQRGKNTPIDYWQYSFGLRPRFELYNIKKDVYCMNNLAVDSENEALIKELRNVLNEQLLAQKDPRLMGEGDIFDSYPFYQDFLQDYYEKFMRGEVEVGGWINESDVDSF